MKKEHKQIMPSFENVDVRHIPIKKKPFKNRWKKKTWYDKPITIKEIVLVIKRKYRLCDLITVFYQPFKVKVISIFYKSF